MDERMKTLVKDVEALVKDVELRAAFEFEEVWRDMLRNPILDNCDPDQLATTKKVMKFGYIAGAHSAVLIVLELVAENICE